MTTHKAPSVQRPREVYDHHGHPLGRSDGFVPDPGTGGLGIELEIDEEARELLDTETTRTWVSADKVIAVRKDRMVLDVSLRELRLLLRERSLQEMPWADAEIIEP